MLDDFIRTIVDARASTTAIELGLIDHLLERRTARSVRDERVLGVDGRDCGSCRPAWATGCRGAGARVSCTALPGSAALRDLLRRNSTSRVKR